MMNRNALLNGKQNLWEIADVAVCDARHQLAGSARDTRFELREWEAEPDHGADELFALRVETGRTPMRIMFARQEIEAFSCPTRAERLDMKRMLLDCLQRLAVGEDTLIRLVDDAPPVDHGQRARP